MNPPIISGTFRWWVSISAYRSPQASSIHHTRIWISHRQTWIPGFHVGVYILFTSSCCLTSSSLLPWRWPSIYAHQQRCINFFVHSVEWTSKINISQPGARMIFWVKTLHNFRCMTTSCSLTSLMNARDWGTFQSHQSCGITYSIKCDKHFNLEGQGSILLNF